MKTLLEVRGLSKRFGKIAALTDVGFHVRAGEIVGLIGPNGAGKSTLFECLAGLLPYEQGEVFHEGRKLPPESRSSLLFYVPDGIIPWAAQTVRWALDFAVGYFQGPTELRDDVVRQLGLEPFKDQTIGSLSKGQRKRALLAIGLLTPQPVLMIDEPFDGLDLRQSRDVMAALRTHAERGRTLFLSIHQIRDASQFCNRLVLLSGGRVCGEGTVEELTTAASAANPSEHFRDLEGVFIALT